MNIEDIEVKKLMNFQMTRLANSLRFAFVNLFFNYLAVRLALVSLIARKKNNSAVTERSKAKKTKCV